MTALTLNRRSILLAAAAGMLASRVSLAQPAPAPALAGNAGFYRFRIGDIAATVLSDGVIGGPPRVYAIDAPEVELGEVLRRAFLPADRLVLNLNTLLLEIGGRRILLEAGADQAMWPTGGRIPAALAAIGLGPADIDAIILSHTHPDHVGGLRNADGGRAFPRATVFAPRADWDFFVRGEPDLSYMPVPEDFRRRFGASIKRSLEPVAQGVELYEPEREILPGVFALAAAGHTPGMAALLVQSGSDQLLLTADLAYHPVVNIARNWRPGPDRDPEAALAARRRIFDRAAVERMPVLGFHYPFPGLGHMLRVDGGYAWVPMGWQF